MPVKAGPLASRPQLTWCLSLVATLLAGVGLGVGAAREMQRRERRVRRVSVMGRCMLCRFNWL